MTFPELPGLKKINQAFCLRAQLTDIEGDRRGAFRDLEAAAKATALLKDDPTLIVAECHFNNENWILVALQNLLARKADRISTKMARPVIQALGPLPELRQILPHITTHCINLPRLLSKAAGTHSLGDDVRFGEYEDVLRIDAVVQANEARAIEYWRSVYRIVPTDGAKTLKAAKLIHLLSERYAKRRGLDYYLSALTMFDVSATAIRIEVVKERRQIWLLAMDILDRHSVSGPWHRLAAPLGRDPFLGAFRVVKGQKNGFRLYSVGPNGVDDGGPVRGRFRDSNDDIGFVCSPSLSR